MRTFLFWIAAFVIAPAGALVACGSSDSPTANPDGGGTDAPSPLDANSPGPDGGGGDVITAQEAAVDAPAEAAPIDWNKEDRFLASIEPAASGGYTLKIEPPNAKFASQTTMATGNTPQMVVVLPSMKFAYVPLGATNAIDGFQVFPDTLKRMAEDPFTVVGKDARFACAHPSSNFLYVTNFGDSTISALKVDGNGILTAAGAATPAAGGPLPCVVDPTGTLLFVASRTASQISAFPIAGDGTVSTRQDFAVAADPVAIALHPKLKVLYVASATGKAVSAFTYAANGALTANGTVTPGTAAAPMPMGLAVMPSGAYLYSSNNADTVVNIWAVDAVTGALSAAGTANVPKGGRAVTADLGGAWLFVHTDDSQITVFDVNASTGALTAHPTTIGGGTNPWADAIFYTGLKVP